VYNSLGDRLQQTAGGVTTTYTLDPSASSGQALTAGLTQVLADNGGGTYTHALLSNSPAINAGDNVGCPATDQRGVSRPQGAACDIGAYEFDGTASTPTATPTATATNTATAAATNTPTASATGNPPTATATATPAATNTPTGGITININFQPASATVPTGYLVDSGAVYGDRGNGYTYGWNADNSANTRDRNSANSPDQRYDTLIHTQVGGTFTWEIALPNGTYTVHLVAGDPSWYNSVYKINAEDVLVVNGTPSSSVLWIEGTAQVTVADGKLTVSNATGSSNNKIDFIEITSGSGPTPTTTATNTATATPTNTATNTATATNTLTATATSTPAATNTPTPTATPSNTPTATNTPGGFPASGVLDDFNRANGAIGSNWSGDTGSYVIASNQLDVNADGYIFWNASSFGADQEAYVTFSNVSGGTEQDLLLKSQSSTTWTAGVLEVWYRASLNVVQVVTYTSAQGWVQRGADIPVTFANGDQFGAKAKANGMVEVYRNGALLATRDVTAWPYYANGGYIGLWFLGANSALLDNFGGGTVAAGSGGGGGIFAAPAPQNTTRVLARHAPSKRLPIVANASVASAPLQSVSSATITYVYDPLYRLKDAIYSSGEEFHYVYDAVGNVLTYTRKVGLQTVVTTYTYNEANELITAQADNDPTVWHYLYDNNGSLTEVIPNGTTPVSGARRYIYDTARRLVQTELHNGLGYQPQAAMEYNGLNERVSMTAWQGGVSLTTTYALDLTVRNGILTANASGQVTAYLYANGDPLGELTASWGYYLNDGTNTPRQMTDSTGMVTLARSYTPWGEVRQQVGTGSFTWGYFGGLMDAATGLVYVGGGQYYDPATGRFLTPVNRDGTNPYVPQRNDPLGAVLAPFALLALLGGRRKNRGKFDKLILMLVLITALGGALAACGGESDESDLPSYEPQPPSLPPVEDTDILDAPWVDEMDPQMWTQYPNSCGPAALYMFLKAEGKSVEYATLIDQLRQERPGGYDGYCCSQGQGPNWQSWRDRGNPTATPDPGGWCNDVCVSAEALASVARKHYGMTIESGDNWTYARVNQKLRDGHAVLALIRVDLSTYQFGHFVVIRGLVDQGSKVVFNDSYPAEDYRDQEGGPSRSEERRTAGEGRRENWYDFDRSWASYIDPMDPMEGSNFNGHVRWAMASLDWGGRR